MKSCVTNLFGKNKNSELRYFLVLSDSLTIFFDLQAYSLYKKDQIKF